jgi:DNA polymerase epsilon subunit 1
MLLIAEMQRLGVRIIHASFSRIVISTNKKLATDGRAYLGFILECLRRNPLFAALDITEKRCWSMLAWIDTVVINNNRFLSSFL